MSVSEPVIKLYDPNDNTRFWDISPITTSVNIAYGRNQPFAVAEVIVKKAYFTSIQNYWGEVQDCPKDGNNNPELPTSYLVDGQSPIHIEAYGSAQDMCVERHESEQSNDYITLLCYNKAYKLKSATTLNSLSRIVLYNRKLYFSYDTGHNNPLSDTINQTGKQTATCVLGGPVLDPDQVSFRVDVASLSNGEVKVEYMEGTGSNIFRFIAMYGAGYTYQQCVCDNGYSYDYGSTINKTYTSSQIEIIKNSSVVETTNSEIIKLRVSSDSNFCWETLKQIGALSNRWPFFYDNAYFVDYNISSNTTLGHIDKYAYMKLDYGLDNQGNSTTYIQANTGGQKDYIDLYEIVSNADQGSTYVQTSQKVYGENYSANISISDIPDNHTGYELYFPYPEQDPTNPQLINNSTRNLLTKKLAFNRIVQNYKPSDAVMFHISEMSSQDQELDVGDRIYYDVSDLPQSATTGDYALVIDGGVIYSYYKWSGSAWVLDESATSLNDRIQKFNPYTVIDRIEDIQNGLTINNAPLAYTKLMWPSCLTEIVFGNPEFMDAQQQWSALTLEAQVSTEQGTEDSLISDRYASKLVIGNQTMSDLADNRQGFTGLIMEKNWDNELYRLSGYNNGVLQAYFNSQGEIMSGNGKVTINEDGITIEDGGGTIDPSLLPDAGIPEWDDTKLDYELNDMVQWEGVLYTYVSSTPGSNIEPGTQNANTVWKQSGDVSLWSILNQYSVGDTVIYDGKVYTCTTQTGNTHYAPGTQSGDTYWQCLVSTDDLSGSINAQNNSIIGGSSSSAPQTDITKQSKTVIDTNGLTTYNASGNAVCRVGTDGNIYGITIDASQINSGYISSDRINSGSISAQNINATKITSGVLDASVVQIQNLTVGGTVKPWTRLTYYNVDDMVTYDNYIYKCIIQHTSSTAFNQSRWSIQNQGYASSQGTASSASSASYADSQGSANSATTQDNATYADSQASQTSSTYSDYAGVGIVRIDQGGLQTYDLSYSGSTQYQSDTTYSTGSVVLYGGHKYTANRYVPSGASYSPPNSTYWTDGGLVAECTVGTNGQITAGSGSQVMNYDGLWFKDQTSTFNYVGMTFGLTGSTSPGGYIYFVGDVGLAQNSRTLNIESINSITFKAGNYFYNLGYGRNSLYGATQSYVYSLLGAQTSFDTTTSFSSSRVGKIVLSNGLIIYCGINTSATSQGTTSVTFQASSNEASGSGYGFSSGSKIIYAQCSSIRSTSGQEGNDYVSNITWSGMDCRHEGGSGFYWIAIGY